jgi:hypothetical protein
VVGYRLSLSPRDESREGVLWHKPPIHRPGAIYMVYIVRDMIEKKGFEGVEVRVKKA